MTQTVLDTLALLKTSVGAGALTLAFVYLVAWLLTWHAKRKASL